MAGEARITFTGNLGADPERRKTPKGEDVASLSVAVTPRKKTDSNEWVDGDTVWYRVSVWRSDAVAVAENLVKGDKVKVEGDLTPSIYHGASGPTLSMDVRADFNGVTKVLRPAKVPREADDDPWT